MEAAAKPSLLKNPFIRLNVLSGILNQIGIWVRNYAILLYVMERTGNDPFAVSLISIAEFAPIFLFAFIGGAFADRWSPKRTRIWCDLLSSLSVFAVLLTILFGTWKAVFFTTFISAVLSQFSQPSALKLYKMHLPGGQMQAGMAINQTMTAIFALIGPAAGAFIYQSFGIEAAIGITGFLFLLSAGVMTFIPKDRVEEGGKSTRSVWHDMQDGLRYVKGSTMLMPLIAAFMLAGLAAGMLQPLGIFIIVEKLGVDKKHLSWFLMTNGAAMLLGGGMIMTMARKIAPQKLLALGLFVCALTTCVIGVSVSLPLTLVVQFINGFFYPCIMIGTSTLVMQSTETSYIGRVNGVINPAFMGAMVISMSAAGWLKATLSLTAVYELGGVLLILGAAMLVPIFKARAGIPRAVPQQANGSDAAQS